METDEEDQDPFTLAELVDLALCSPEIGTVNFNILRLLLHDIVEKLGIESMPVTLTDVQSNHVEHYKSYIQGNAQTTPLPGVLRVTAPGYSYGVKSQMGTDGTKNVIATTPSMKKTPRTPKTGRESISTGTEVPGQTATTSPQGAANVSNTPTSPRLLDATKALEEKVGRLERHLDALYQLPTNQSLLDGGKDGKGPGGGGMTVNDMWQIIQLNNRVASCESAIQKMASLIEDLATDLSRMKGDSKSFQNDAENLLKSHSRLSTDMSPLPEKCQMVQEALDELKKDLDGIRAEWKHELDKITQAVGVDPNKIPSFMKTSGGHSHSHHHQDKSKSKHDHHKHPETSTSRTSASSDGKPKNKKHRSPESLVDLSPSEIAKLSPSDLEQITPSVMENMTPEQIAAIKKRRSDKKPKKKKNLNNMRPAELSALTIDELNDLDPDEAAAVKPSKLVHMTPEQRKKLDEVKKRQQHKIDLDKMSPDEIADLRPSELALLTPSQAAMLTDSVLSLMTPEQLKQIEAIAAKAGKDKDLTKLSPKEIDKLTEEQQSDLTPEQKELLDSKTKPKPQVEGPDHGHNDDDGTHDHVGPRKSPTDPSKKSKPVPSRHRGKGGHGHGQGHAPVDILKGTIPRAEALPPVKLDDPKDMVQAELQKQYGQLQAMQRQMANDIHDKMEFIYEKLLKDIVTQNDGALPYMAVGGPAVAVGPGVCTGAGMPAGVAVCQFPEAGGRHPGLIENKVCPGPGLCPANENCPNCSPLAAQAGRGPPNVGAGLATPAPGMQQQHQPPIYSDGTYGHPHPGGGVFPMSQTGGGPGGHRDQEDQMLLKEMRSLILLDLEKIREDMKERDVNVFDEQDIVERMDTIWEAIKIIKNNEETLAVKILRQDAILKKLPKETIDRIHKIPAENLEAIASAKWDKPLMLPSGTAVASRSVVQGGRKMSQGPKNIPPAADSSSMDKEEVQKIYNNLTNLIAETTEQKDKLDRLGDQVRTMEVGMVTKQMLVDALGDKADKGQINTKVSYDEFGTAIDELHTNLRDMVVENFNKNEHWNRVTNDLAEGVHNKLDKNELAPVKSFFKSHLKSLVDKVNHLQRQFDEPDPAGTRKKLLRDFNCISCDRHCNISGVTNAPTLPTIGPILAGHTTASRRAFDLHRMRNKNKLLEDCRDLTLMEKQLKCLGLLNPDGTPKRASDLDLVNRFQGGSHTAISNASRIRSQRGSGRPGTAVSMYDEEEASVGASDQNLVIGSSEVMNGFRMPDKDLEQAEETEQLLQSYIPAYIEE